MSRSPTPDVSPQDPKVTLRSLLQDHWDDAEVTTDYEERHEGFGWVIDDHFRPARWIYTRWYNDSNPQPEVTVTFDGFDPGTATGFDATTGDGGLSSWQSNRAYIDCWAEGDEPDEHTDGIHPARYAWQLCVRVQLIVLLRAQNPPGRWTSLGIGEVRAPDDPDTMQRWRIPVLFSDQKST